MTDTPSEQVDHTVKKHGSTKDLDELTYDEVTITTTAGYRPMIGVTAAVVIPGIILTVYPIYFHDPGNGVTLLTYTGLLWGVIITLAAVVHEYYVTKNENRNAAGESA